MEREKIIDGVREMLKVKDDIIAKQGEQIDLLNEQNTLLKKENEHYKDFITGLNTPADTSQEVE